MDKPQKRSAPRFSLRTMLIALTLGSLLAGWFAARYRSAARTVARRNDVLSMLLDRRAQPPGGLQLARVDTLGLFAKPRADIDEFFRMDRSSASAGAWEAFWSGESAGTTTMACSYEFTPAVDGLPAVALRDRIQRHFEHGFEMMALFTSSTSTTTSDGGDQASGRQIWATKNNGISVVLDTDVDTVDEKAIVRILLIESQSVGAW
ncbi:hypothetical protein [Pirellulimonas nuda]|nr:hypothetical protein [Pirellulimonas nuda]